MTETTTETTTTPTDRAQVRLHAWQAYLREQRQRHRQAIPTGGLREAALYSAFCAGWKAAGGLQVQEPAPAPAPEPTPRCNALMVGTFGYATCDLPKGHRGLHHSAG
jgi:hypothetical protein